MIEIHIISRGKKWAVKKKGAKRASKLYDTAGEATWHAINMGKENIIFVHRKDGTIQCKLQT